MKFLSTKFLFEEVSSASLGLLRILFGIFMLKDFYLFFSYFTTSLHKQLYFATYDGFHWVRMMPLPLMYLFFGVLLLACIFFILGLFFRISAIICFFGFTYAFLIDHGHYNNHFYLYCMFHFFFIVTDANRWGAIEKTSIKTIPYWQIFIFKFQLFIVYFYGAIAKADMDWLQGYPMRYWLYMVADKFEGGVAHFLKQAEAAYFISYGGLFFDLFIGFMLFSYRFQRIAIIFVFLFHFSNHFLWDIGTFPFVMFYATSIFFAPNWPEEAWQYFKSKKISVSSSFFVGLVLLTIGLYFHLKGTSFIGMVFFGYFLVHEFQFSFFQWFWTPFIAKQLDATPNYIYNKQKLVLFGVTTWFLVQMALPFRHYLFVGHPSWNGEGHLFAWRMMLIATTDAVKIKLVDPQTQEAYPIRLEAYMNFRQFSKLGRTPKTYLHFAHFIRDEAIKGGMEKPIIKMEIWKSVNERAPRLLNDTTLNYAEVPYQQFVPCTWYNDWNPDMDPLEFRDEQFQHWEEVIKSSQVDGF